jgi:signal transduction histidine kinase
VVVALDRISAGGPVAEPRRLDGIDVAVYAPDGHRLAGAGPATADAATRTALHGRVVDDNSASDLTVVVPVAAGEKVVAAVRAASSRAATLHRVELGWLVLTGLAIVALAPPALAARRQARRLASPLEALAGQARRLGDGDFTIAAPPSGITEIDTPANALADTARRLGTLVSRERQFTREASHQLRTPLTGLRLLLETGIDADDVSLRRAAGQAVAAVDRIEDRIDDLLKVRGEPTCADPLDTAALLDDVEDTYRGVLAAMGRQLRIVRNGGLPVVDASTAAVRQTVGVLVDNAVRHGRGEVTVALRNANGALAIDVLDEGGGVRDAPSEDVTTWTPGPAAGHGGHGLGLRLAGEQVAGQRGRLLHRQVRSLNACTDRCGALFTVLLPGRDKT